MYRNYISRYLHIPDVHVIQIAHNLNIIHTHTYNTDIHTHIHTIPTANIQSDKMMTSLQIKVHLKSIEFLWLLLLTPEQ